MLVAVQAYTFTAVKVSDHGSGTYPSSSAELRYGTLCETCYEQKTDTWRGR